MKPSKILVFVFTLCLLVCAISPGAAAHNESASASSSGMSDFGAGVSFPFVLQNVQDGVFLTIAQPVDANRSGVPVFYLKYDPDDDGEGDNEVKCFALVNGSQRDLKEDSCTLEAGVTYTVSAQGNLLTLSREDSVVFACPIPEEPARESGMSEPPTYAQEFAACTLIGVGNYTLENGQYTQKYNVLGATTTAAPSATVSSGASPSSASPGDSSAQLASSENSVASTESAADAPAAQDPAPAPNQENNPSQPAASSMAVQPAQLLQQPWLWIAAFFLLVAIGTPFVFWAHRSSVRKKRRYQGRHASSPRQQKQAGASKNKPRPDQPKLEPEHTPSAAPRVASTVYPDTAPLVQQPISRVSAPDFTNWMEESGQESGGTSSDQFKKAREYDDSANSILGNPHQAPKPVIKREPAEDRISVSPLPQVAPAAKPTPVPPSPPAPPKADPLRPLIDTFSTLYGDSQTRDQFNDRDAGFLYLDLDPKATVSLHYEHDVAYRFVVSTSTQNYLMSSFILANEQYVFLNYFRYNRQKNDFCINSAMIDQIHLYKLYRFVDRNQQPVQPQQALGHTIHNITPAVVRPDGDGYVLEQPGVLELM